MKALPRGSVTAVWRNEFLNAITQNGFGELLPSYLGNKTLIVVLQLHAQLRQGFWLGARGEKLKGLKLANHTQT